jgi:hypothetical protein
MQGTFTFMEHSGKIQGTCKERSHSRTPRALTARNLICEVRNMQGTFTFREHAGNIYIQGTSREHSHSGNIQGTFREHSGNIQGTFREHSGNIQGTFASPNP